MFEYIAMSGITRNGIHAPYLHTYGIDFTGYPFHLPTVVWNMRGTLHHGSPSEAWSTTGRVRGASIRDTTRDISDIILMGEPYYETSELVVVRLAWLDGRDPSALLPTAWGFLTNPQYPFLRRQ